MTFEQRMAELGVDLSDLPERYEAAPRIAAFDAADKFGGSLSMTQNFEDYILHLTDIIDRMETRLVNVTGERDWLKHMLCEMCDMEENGPSCAHCNVKTGGVPE